MARRRGRSGRFASSARRAPSRARAYVRRTKRRPGLDEVLVPLSPTLEAVITDLAAGKDMEYAGATATSRLFGYNYQTGKQDFGFAWDKQWWPGIKRSVVWGFAKAVGRHIPGIKQVLAWGANVKVGKFQLIGGPRGR